MKKITLLLIISSMLVSMVGCGKSSNNNNSTSDTTTTTQTVEETTTDTTVETTIEGTTPQETSTNGAESTGSVDLQAIVDEITSKEEWASLSKIEDEALISEFFTLDPNNPNYKQLLVMQCPMSAVIAEIILIETDDTKSAMEDLNARREKLINTDAFYPEHKEIAEESIVGSHGNIAYFIAGDEEEDSERILINYLDSLS